VELVVRARKEKIDNSVGRLRGVVIELGCWTHARRTFHDATASDSAHAHVAMAHIRRLYAIEAEAREHD